MNEAATYPEHVIERARTLAAGSWSYDQADGKEGKGPGPRGARFGVAWDRLTEQGRKFYLHLAANWRATPMQPPAPKEPKRKRAA